MSASPAPVVVLGSGSRYRRELLGRLLPQFEVVVPAVDETPQAGEAAEALAQRLADLKATTVAKLRPGAIVIGSDQVAESQGEVLGKPGSAEAAVRQLLRCAGRDLVLHTAVSIAGPTDGRLERHVDRTLLRFRVLERAQIEQYVARDQPLDCAGSFRFESLGAALFERVETADPTAIQGLPLLWLTSALTRAGVRVL